MSTITFDRRVAEEKAKAPQEKVRQNSAPVPEEHPRVRRTFDEIYASDKFTLEAAIKAFTKP